jgi:hypothetical protein
MAEEIRPGSLGRFHARKRPRLPQDEPAVIMAIGSIGPESHDWSSWLVPVPVLKTGESMPRKALWSVRFRRQSCTEAVMDNHRLLHGSRVYIDEVLCSHQPDWPIRYGLVPGSIGVLEALDRERLWPGTFA